MKIGNYSPTVLMKTLPVYGLILSILASNSKFVFGSNVRFTSGSAIPKLNVWVLFVMLKVVIFSLVFFVLIASSNGNSNAG